jgi:hypothetical protein
LSGLYAAPLGVKQYRPRTGCALVESQNVLHSRLGLKRKRGMGGVVQGRP